MCADGIRLCSETEVRWLRVQGGYFKRRGPSACSFPVTKRYIREKTNDAGRKGDHQRKRELDKEEPGNRIKGSDDTPNISK